MFRPPPPRASSAASTDAGPSSAPISAPGGDGAGRVDMASEDVIGPPTEQSTISRMMADNPYFSAGAGLMGIGVVLTTARTLIRGGSSLAQRRMLVTLEIPSKDRSYPWFLEWMAQHAPQHPTQPSGAISTLRSVLKGKAPMSLRSHELAVETSVKQHENGSSEAVFNLVPGPGTHYFRFKGSWFQIEFPVMAV